MAKFTTIFTSYMITITFLNFDIW